MSAADPQPPAWKQISREVNGTWRTTKYERTDGTTFLVSVPARVDLVNYAHHYDDEAEAKMVAILNRDGRR